MATPHRRNGTRLLPATAVVVLILAGLVPASGPAPGVGRDGRGPADRAAAHVPGEILIGFKDEATERERRSIRAALGARRLRGFGRSGEHLRLGAGRTTKDAVDRCRDHPLVEYAEPNYLWSLDLLPDDPRFVELYGLRNTGQTGGTPGADIDVEAAWDLTAGTHAVIVGVIDSGVDYNHPDLAANIWLNPGEIPNNGIDDDGNGYVDDVRGWDFANDDNDPFDDLGHGTHVAGTIGAVGDNGRGIDHEQLLGWRGVLPGAARRDPCRFRGRRAVRRLGRQRRTEHGCASALPLELRLPQSRLRGGHGP
jgi:subtilisin family serine protease